MLIINAWAIDIFVVGIQMCIATARIYILTFRKPTLRMVPLPVDSRFLGVLGCTGLEEIIHGFSMMAFKGWYDDLPLGAASLDATLP